jgi:hypothetical protein
MTTEEREFPLELNLSLSKIFDHYRNLADTMGTNNRFEKVLEIEKKYPKLSTGLSSEEEVLQYQDQIDIVLDDLFPSALQLNEIKIATTPFQQSIFKSTQRYKNIIKAAGKDFEPEIKNFDENHFYIMGCSIILNQHYGYKIDFRRPFFYNIPDANGNIKNYRVLYNGDFIDIEKTDKSLDITQEDIDILVENFDNIEIWKEKFPVGSWKFKGFVIANLFDVTTDVSISDFKSHLLKNETDSDPFVIEFERIFRTIFGIEDLKIGFADFNYQDQTIEKLPFKNVSSYILGDSNQKSCSESFCETSYHTIFKEHELYIVTNVSKYHYLYPQNPLYQNLKNNGVESIILASIVHNNKVLGVLELVSSKVNALNTINANKLQDIMPFLIDSVVRSKQQTENELELIIQEECTSIHKSVHWKFLREAKRYYAAVNSNTPANFREITFEDVYPLFGQIDIKGSSEARNAATKKDLELQLTNISKIIKKAHKLEKLPIYEQLVFRIEGYLKDFKDHLQVDSERQVLDFLKGEIIPLFRHLEIKNPELKKLIQSYKSTLETGTGLIYKYRKDYDETVMLINKRMASILDSKQRDAQKMYPHYFERFKTDGVEHNMYIGEAITKDESFNKIYLYNLRMWQLQAMCEMENSYYKLKEKLPVPLDVASMILVFNSSLSLRFRMDEKRFDVDGTYNARYEVVKKRVDKANIKGTEERITQAGKISIIYSQREDEKEYKKYIQFLQHKKLLDTDVEVLELEDLQGVTGLKALRVSVLYSKGKDNTKEYYTYEDLVKEINS